MTVALPVPGRILLDQWGIPLTQQCNDHDAILAASLPLLKRKTANTSVISQTVLQPDADLTVPVEANSNYRMRSRVLYNSGTTPDFKFLFTFPALTTMSYTVLCLAAGVFGAFEQTELITGIIDGTGADRSVLMDGTVSTGANPGSLTFTWAQNVSTASNTFVKIGSYLELVKILS